MSGCAKLLGSAATDPVHLSRLADEWGREN